MPARQRNMLLSVLLPGLNTFILLTTALILPSPPSLYAHRPPLINTTRNPLPPQRPSSTNPSLADFSVECFKPTMPRANPLVVDDCARVIEEVILYDPVGLMEPVRFSHYPRDGEYRVPQEWGIHGAQCTILLTSGDDSKTDAFRLVDVIVRANDLIAECPAKNKRALGGLALIGHGKTFFVAVNGPDDYPDWGLERERDGNGTLLRLWEDSVRGNRFVA